VNSNPSRTRIRILAVLLLTAMIVSAAAPAALAEGGSLAEAYKIIESKKFVDLTHSFSPLTPVWKGFGQATFSRAANPRTGQPYTIAKDHFRAFFSLLTVRRWIRFRSSR
jgi:hypothetical protein